MNPDWLTQVLLAEGKVSPEAMQAWLNHLEMNAIRTSVDIHFFLACATILIIGISVLTFLDSYTKRRSR